MRTRILALLTVLIALTGCSTAGPTQSLIAQAAVTYGTAKAIEDGLDPLAVIRYVGVARAALDESDDLAAVTTVVLRRLDDAALSPADLALAQTLVIAVATALGDVDLLDSTTRLRVSEVLGWVELAARVAGPQA